MLSQRQTLQLSALSGALLFALAAPAPAAEPAGTTVQQTYQEIEKTLGGVPSFMKAFPESGIAGAWQEFKTVQLNPETALPGKVKELIGLAVAAQIPCEYCIYFHTKAAKLNGASDEEVKEAIAMAAITRHWSTVLNGSQIDKAAFRQETDQAMQFAADQMRAGSEAKK
jgi:AhpD family alkylhydroperoxidase